MSDADVVTGIVEHLGGYHLSDSMDENTTHVISGGVRTLKVGCARVRTGKSDEIVIV